MMLTVLYVAACFLFAFAAGLLEEPFVAFSSQDNAVSIHDAAIVYDSKDPVGVEIAAKSLRADFKQITGKAPELLPIHVGDSDPFGGDAPETAIIAATTNSSLMQSLAERKLVNVSSISGKWEAFQTSLVQNPFQGVKDALVIAGSDKRAVIFGIHTLAEQCGQSPYHWWADVPTTKHDEIYALPVTTTHGEPAVKYRGLFINDEAPALTGWWSKQHNVNHYPLDSEFYRHVFDMLLRLKANFMWPAMWASFVPEPGNIFFTDDPYNQQMADDYGIVISTSHHEPMQRATNEWDEDETGPWDWTENKANVTRFMEEGVRRAGKNESYFTMGMRGPNDSPISGGDPIKILRDVFETERDILAKYYGNVTAANQAWTIYKEVMTYYAAGLLPPEDVTLVFTDDNWGNIMRLPDANETARSGGVGLYYHLEYVGVPKSYKWQNTNNLAKIYKELSQALERDATRIWVINVADIKPMEVPFGFIMDLAWNPSKFEFARIPEYLKAFASREFGSEHADEIAAILMEHSHLIGRRKYESTTSMTYSFYNYHEIERVTEEWKDLADRVTKVGNALPEENQATFFHLVRYPVHAGYIYHAVVLGQSTNLQYAIQRRNTANEIAYKILDDFEVDGDLSDEYNTILDGKWNGIMNQPKYDQWMTTDWKAPSRDVVQNLSFVQLRQNLDYEFGNLGIYAEGSDSATIQGRICASIDPSQPTTDDWTAYLPTMDQYGPAVRTVDMFHRGDHRVPIHFELNIPNEWVKIEPSSGNVTRDHLQQRLEVSIDWDNAPSDFDDDVTIGVHYDTSPFFDQFHIPVQNRRAPASFKGFPETSGMISIEAAHYQRASKGSIAFEPMQYLGTRTNSGAIGLRPYKAARKSTSEAEAATAEYDIYLFDSADVEATLYFTQGLDTDPKLPMEFSLTVDSGAANFTRVLAEPETPGDLPDVWEDHVADSVWMHTVSLGNLESGQHTLKWQVNSPEVYLEKIVLDTGDAVGDSYLGPPETKIV